MKLLALNNKPLQDRTLALILRHSLYKGTSTTGVLAVTGQMNCRLLGMKDITIKFLMKPVIHWETFAS